MKQPIILRVFKNGQLTEVKQFAQDQVIVGSSPDAQLRLQDESVSELHCVIELRPQGYFVGDLGSSAGTLLQGQPVLDAAVSSGQRIGIGVFEIHFFVGAPKPGNVSASVAPVVEKPVEKPAEKIPEKSVERPVEKPAPEKKMAPPPVVEKPKVERPAAPPPKMERPSPRPEPVRRAAHGTYAPGSAIADLRQYLKPTQGVQLEVVIAWGDRVLNSLHFTQERTITLGSSAGSHIFVPTSLIPTQIGFIEFKGGARVFVPSFASVEVIQSAGKLVAQDELLRTGRATTAPSGGLQVALKSGEMVHVGFGEAGWNLYIRFIPQPPVVPVPPPVFSAGELSTLLLTMGVVVLLAFAMSLVTPEEKDKEPELEPIRQAQFVYKKKIEITQQGDPKEELGKQQAPVKVEVKEEKPDAPKSEQKTTAEADSAKAAKAQEVRAKPTQPNKPKQFTSSKSGSAVKLAPKEAANAQSQQDVTKQGLLGAFGGAGVRKQLDKAYSGSGDLLGMADKASGSAGQAESRGSGDIGSKFKDTGAGGKGTATQGIGGIGTKGRSSGQGEYGDLGSGGKGSVSIVSSGEGAGFTGGLDKAGIRRTILSMYGEIKACYESGLRSASSMEGRVSITFEIDDKGQVIASKVGSSNLGSDEVGDCIANRIRVKRFPPSPPGVVGLVEYPFVLSAQK